MLLQIYSNYIQRALSIVEDSNQFIINELSNIWNFQSRYAVKNSNNKLIRYVMQSELS